MYFDGRKIHALPTHFFQCNSSGQKINIVLTYFFDVILMVEKSTLFARNCFDEISTGKNSTLFLVKLQANENIRGRFSLLVTLKNSLLQDLPP